MPLNAMMERDLKNPTPTLDIEPKKSTTIFSHYRKIIAAELSYHSNDLDSSFAT